MSEHSPTPWDLDPKRITVYDAGQNVIADFYWPGSDLGPVNCPAEEEARANANLLLAAPNLLEACRAYIAFGDQELTSTTRKGKIREVNEMLRKESDIRLQIQEAITKAEGS